MRILRKTCARWLASLKERIIPVVVKFVSITIKCILSVIILSYSGEKKFEIYELLSDQKIKLRRRRITSRRKNKN